MLENRLKEIIQEELGIHEMVKDASWQIVDKICQDVAREEYISDNPLMKRATFNFELNGSKILVSCNYFNFRNPDEKNKILSERPELSDSWSAFVRDSMFFLTINIGAVSGNFDKASLAENVQHELEHVFQQSKMHKSFGNEKSNAVYSLVKSYIHSSDEIERSIATILYMPFKYEQDAFVNGLYGYLFTNVSYGLPANIAISKSEAYKKVEALRYSINVVKSKPNDVNNALEKYRRVNFNITQQRLLDYGENAVSNMLRKIYRTYQKYCNGMEKIIKYKK